eukprot:TRINITY_DN2737_c0_g3_i1.p6 TRINITY_DN2737_c0_g3~~TRINITY_DN2737_c0_g3_i1.p6  ORF type:complete len:131 (+),score=61.01 TRINITY_DN2737_c0_g3_i1:2139-2531(+)
MDQIMMLLKGEAVNMHHDYEFIADVTRQYLASEELAAEGFMVGLAWVRQHVQAAYGRQRDGGRWIMNLRQEPSYDEVEDVLVGIKQFILCYDRLSPAAKRALKSRELIMNSSNLRQLAALCSAKYLPSLE